MPRAALQSFSKGDASDLVFSLFRSERCRSAGAVELLD